MVLSKGKGVSVAWIAFASSETPCKAAPASPLFTKAQSGQQAAEGCKGDGL